MKRLIKFTDNQGKEIMAIDIAQTLDRLLQELNLSKFILRIVDKKIEIDTDDDFKLITDEDIKLIKKNKKLRKFNDDTTIQLSKAREHLIEKECKRAIINMAVDNFIENWLRYGITEMKACYKDRTFYTQINKGFNEPERYFQSLNGWDNDTEMWNRKFVIKDEIHRIGGLRQ